jgi:hypothetical protein
MVSNFIRAVAEVNLRGKTVFLCSVTILEVWKPETIMAANINSWIFTVENCISGLSNTQDSQSKSPLMVYGGDQNCLGKLNAFSAFSKNFYPKSGSEFKEWSPGSTAIFTDQTKELDVQVIQQLPSTVLAPSIVSYQVYEKDIDPKVYSLGSFRFGAPSLVKQNTLPVPFGFRPNSVKIKQLNFSRQTLSLVVQVECSSVLASDGRCINTKVEELSYALIENKYRGLPCQASNPANCWKIIAGQNNPPIKVSAPSSGYNGGFVSSEVDTNHTPFQNPKYLFLVGNMKAVWILPISFLSRAN